MGYCTPLVPQRRLKTFVALNLIAAVPVPLLTALLLPRFGLSGAGYAAIAANAVGFVAFLQDQWRALRFRLSYENLILLGVTVLAFTGEIALHQGSLIYLAGRAGLGCLWLALAVRISNRYMTWASFLATLKRRFGRRKVVLQ